MFLSEGVGIELDCISTLVDLAPEMIIEHFRFSSAVVVAQETIHAAHCLESGGGQHDEGGRLDNRGFALLCTPMLFLDVSL